MVNMNKTALCFGVVTFTCVAHAQTLTFLRQISPPEFIESSGPIAADPTGAYVAGVMRPSTSPYDNFNTDAFLRKYDSTGTQIWARQFGGPLNVSSIATANGAVFVAGFTAWNIAAQVYFSLPGQTPNGFQDAFVRRYNADGSEIWTRQFGGEAGDFAMGVAADNTGVYVVWQLGAFLGPGQNFLRKYDLDGNQLWEQKLTVGSAIATDGTSVYVTGSIAPSGDNNEWSGFVSKFDSTGASIWTRQLDPGAIPTTLAAGSSGMYVAGRSQLLPGKTFLCSYDSDGNQQWTLEFPAGTASGLAIGASAIYTAGSISGALPGQCSAGSGDVYVKSYDFSGAELWTHQFGSYEADTSGQIAIDALGIYVSGTRANGYYYSTSSGAFLARLVNDSPIITSGPRIRQECVLNSANYLGGGVAPGELVTILGSQIGPAAAATYSVSVDSRIPTTLAETQVFFNGVAAPLLFASKEQINAIAPSGLAARASVDVQVEYKGLHSQVVTLPVLPSRPGVFSLDHTGTGQAAALNEDGTVNSSSNPASRGSIVTFYVTGAGRNKAVSSDDQLQSDPAPPLSGEVSVIMTYAPDFDIEDGAFVEVLYAGGVPGSVEGLVQINVRLPPEGTYAPPEGMWLPQVYIGGWPWDRGAIPSENFASISVR